MVIGLQVVVVAVVFVVLRCNSCCFACIWHAFGHSCITRCSTLGAVMSLSIMHQLMPRMHIVECVVFLLAWMDLCLIVLSLRAQARDGVCDDGQLKAGSAASPVQGHRMVRALCTKSLCCFGIRVMHASMALP